MDQPTAEQALRWLEPLAGEWTLDLIGCDTTNETYVQLDSTSAASAASTR
jgi:hypothetical protein